VSYGPSSALATITAEFLRNGRITALVGTEAGPGFDSGVVRGRRAVWFDPGADRVPGNQETVSGSSRGRGEMTGAETQAVEVSRNDPVSGYVYEHDESMATVKEIRRTHQQPINWWHTRVDANVDAKAA
jgi:hypothetical protein